MRENSERIEKGRPGRMRQRMRDDREKKRKSMAVVEEENLRMNGKLEKIKKELQGSKKQMKR